MSLFPPLLLWKALIVEDNILNQKVLAHNLKLLGWDYETAENGLEALSASEHTTFQVILMDIEMPVMGGLDATKQIRQREQRLGQTPVTIVGLSANAQKEQIRTAKEAGMDDYITKPVHRATLANVLHRLSTRTTLVETESPPSLFLPTTLKSETATTPLFQMPTLTHSEVKRLSLELKTVAKELLAQQFHFRAFCENHFITIELPTLSPYLRQFVLTQFKHISEKVLQGILTSAIVTEHHLQLVASTPKQALKLKAILSKAGFAEAFHQPRTQTEKIPQHTSSKLK